MLATFNRGMLALNCASAIVPLRPAAGTLVKPAPLPLNVIAVTAPAKAALPPSKATFAERRASGIVPRMLAAERAVVAVLAAPAFGA